MSFFNSKLSTLSALAQERFVEFVIEENAKELDFINGTRTPAEKAIVFLVDAFVEGRENQGLNVSPKIAGFAKKVKNPNVSNRDWKYIPAPKKDEITGIKGLTEAKRKTSIQGGGKLRNRWKDSEGNIYEWDSQHGTYRKI
ncbi:Colicin-E3 [Actinobacillus lignieresii]|uniref:colicin E3/pyocin S6 family cytotoxin n=1 Tax=Actinobacillus lignieresii TaxID=720 RepID=UPI000E130023|nr:colicin E3/pyocin S6 family cytotoxin [Actinobacillus lignieresii]SUT96552.1 Colicin-E3 [Actinobacillus lignieresii]